MFTTDPAEMVRALRGAVAGFVTVHVDKTDCIHEAVKVVSVSAGEDPVVTYEDLTGSDPPPPTPVSGLRSVQIGH